MAEKRATTLVVYLAPTEDDTTTKLKYYSTPEDFRLAFKNEADRPPKWKFTYKHDAGPPPKYQPKFGNIKTGFHYLLTYSAENKFLKKHLVDVAAGKASQEPPTTEEWSRVKMDFSFLHRGCMDLYYLGEEQEESSEKPDVEGRDFPIPSIERDENGKLYISSA